MPLLTLPHFFVTAALFLPALVPPPPPPSDNSTVVAPSSSLPFPASVCFNCLHDRAVRADLTARQLGQAAAGVWSACVSAQMINVLLVTV